jgi:ribosomal protein S18 acetylase RimI-like enzyme
MISKVTKLDDDLIDLYINSFKNDLIYNKTRPEAINNREMIIKLFNIYSKYGIILSNKVNNKICSLMVVLDINKISNDAINFKLIFDKDKFPGVYNFIKENNYSGEYILLLCTDINSRNKGMATELVNYYINNYFSNSLLFVDVDNIYSYKIFNKLNFQKIALDRNYYIFYRKDY